MKENLKRTRERDTKPARTCPRCFGRPPLSRCTCGYMDGQQAAQAAFKNVAAQLRKAKRARS